MLGFKPFIKPKAIHHASMYWVISDEDSPGHDSTVALQLAIDTCSDLGVELYIPPGTYNISAPIVSTKSKFFIRGAGTATRIRTTVDTINALELGPGTIGSGLEPSGYLSSLVVAGPGKAPTTSSKGVFLRGLRYFKVEEVCADNFTVGFDMIENCYGTKFFGCRTIFDGCRVGLVLRGLDGGVWGSGSDIPFYDCWLHGVDGGVWIHPDGTGYHFYGGQLTGGSSRTADADGFGSVVIGKNYYTNAIGNVGTVDFNGIDFEGAQRVWQIRGYGRANVAIRSCALLGTNASNKSLGVLKIETAENGQWKFTDNTVDGQYSQVSLMQYSGHGTAFSIREEGTLFGFGCYANGVQALAGQTLTQQANLNIGVTEGRVGGYPFVGLGRGRLRWDDTNKRMEVAKDNGAGTYYPITGFVTSTAGRPSTDNYAGRSGFDTDINKPIWRNAANTGWILADGTSTP